MSTLQLPFTLSAQELQIIHERLREFKALGTQGNKEWFSELCYCLLTANAQAKKALAIQQALGLEGFLAAPIEQITATIRAHNHRFHNNKAQYIVFARNHITIKDCLASLSSSQAREFLVAHIKGLGYKEASHFLRNVGYDDVAIIDRHILRFLEYYTFIDKIPKIISKKKYLELEQLLLGFGFSLSALDLMIWYHMTGTVLK
jgi:N-glycosylase/DNA lyase